MNKPNLVDYLHLGDGLFLTKLQELTLSENITAIRLNDLITFSNITSNHGVA